ncbi:MAG: hypothetical protein V7739_15890, partial [Motiliproteus sp.]
SIRRHRIGERDNYLEKRRLLQKTTSITSKLTLSYRSTVFGKQVKKGGYLSALFCASKFLLTNYWQLFLGSA